MRPSRSREAANDSSDAGGIEAICRWLSEATPPVGVKNTEHPAGCQSPRLLGYCYFALTHPLFPTNNCLLCLRCDAAAIPLGCGRFLPQKPVVSSRRSSTTGNWLSCLRHDKSQHPHDDIGCLTEAINRQNTNRPRSTRRRQNRQIKHHCLLGVCRAYVRALKSTF